ncbi:MAG: sulfotransferase domain-containing protein [Roseibium sp.]|uniref:sulfotransferase domain-containing protein n=1 Tax=Roseibium sp. TaxID=1936156 RepID=UPI00262FE0C6|nr:sulfotransferase domain-containing protein [Roseibium sp.]MCV0428445.1 sulfotransferase domain-containing protein [Roseibium sp.]
MTEKQSIIFFGLARGGSSVTCDIVGNLALAAGMKWLDVGKELYDQGIPLSEAANMNKDHFPETGHFIGPFREVPKWLLEKDLSKFKIVIVTRDPRDCVVSHYFAMRHYHSVFVPGQKTDFSQKGRELGKELDEYVLDEAAPYEMTSLNLITLARKYPESLLFRYEDIYDLGERWVYLINELLGILDDRIPLNIVGKAHFKAEKEDVNVHKRKGTPGDFREKLKAETQAMLTKTFDPINSQFLELAYKSDGDDVAQVEQLWGLLKDQYQIIVELQRQNHLRKTEIHKLTDQLNELRGS